MANTVHEARLQGIVVYVCKYSQSKNRNTTTMVRCGLISEEIGHSARESFELTEGDVKLDIEAPVSKFPLYFETSCHISR